MFKKENFPTTLFVSASLLAFIVFVVLFMIFSMNARQFVADNQPASSKPYSRLFLKEPIKSADQMTTRVPSLSDVLAGPIITEDDPALGEVGAPVDIVMFSDFKCRYCLDQEKEIKKALEKYHGKVRFTWKDYPEKNIGSESFQAAVAARCAAEQGKFWEYHDLLLAQIHGLDESVYADLAKNLNLDTQIFEECWDSQRTRKYILNNMTEADALEISGVPFVYVNDQKISGEINFDDLCKEIDSQLQKNNGQQ